jgi:hypothetical protein
MGETTTFFPGFTELLNRPWATIGSPVTVFVLRVMHCPGGQNPCVFKLLLFKEHAAKATRYNAFQKWLTV